MKKTSIFICLLFVALVTSTAYALMNPIGTCGYFLGLQFQDKLTSAEQVYLGIMGKRVFPLKDIKGSVFVIEVFSTFCTSCPRNIPVINAVYSAVENEPALKDRVRVFSLAIGNTRQEVDAYRKDFKILYPILTDYTFAAHKALGNPRVPYTLIVRKTERGRCVVEYSHQGIHPSAEEILKQLKGST
ncbi:MAG: TlpA disulfide reductase family protein [Nitrospirota bacterium]